MASNRGPHPEDADHFGPAEHERLRDAVRDLSWLRSRGYTGSAAQTLVGDRYQLTRRQRNAVGRSACTDEERAHRLRARMSSDAVRGQELHIDAFNVLISIEAALGGAYLFVGRDTAYRDVNPLKGTYRIVRQTDPALELLADTLAALTPRRVVWHLDRSISNVGRVKKRLRSVASKSDVEWGLEESDHVDASLRTVSAPVVTSDSAILDASDAWFHLESIVHGRHVADANVVDLRPDGERSTGPLDVMGPPDVFVSEAEETARH